MIKKMTEEELLELIGKIGEDEWMDATEEFHDLFRKRKHITPEDYLDASSVSVSVIKHDYSGKKFEPGACYCMKAVYNNREITTIVYKNGDVILATLD